MSERPLMNERAAAAQLGLAVRTVQKMRHQGRGPKFLKLGRVIRYEPSELRAWIDASRRSTTKGDEPADSSSPVLPVVEREKQEGKRPRLVFPMEPKPSGLPRIVHVYETGTRFCLEQEATSRCIIVGYADWKTKKLLNLPFFRLHPFDLLPLARELTAEAERLTTEWQDEENREREVQAAAHRLETMFGSRTE